MHKARMSYLKESIKIFVDTNVASRHLVNCLTITRLRTPCSGHLIFTLIVNELVF